VHARGHRSRIRSYQRVGVRGMSSPTGSTTRCRAALEEGDKGIFINLLNRFQTGRLLQDRSLPRHDRVSRSCRFHQRARGAVEVLSGDREARRPGDADVPVG